MNGKYKSSQSECQLLISVMVGVSQHSRLARIITALWDWLFPNGLFSGHGRWNAPRAVLVHNYLHYLGAERGANGSMAGIYAMASLEGTNGAKWKMD